MVEKGYQGHMFLIPNVDLFLCCVLSLFPFPHAQDGITPLYVACQNGHKQIVIVLLESGANANLSTTVSSLSGAYSELSSCLQHLFVCMQYLCYPHHCCNIPCDKPLE